MCFHSHVWLVIFIQSTRRVSVPFPLRTLSVGKMKKLPVKCRLSLSSALLKHGIRSPLGRRLHFHRQLAVAGPIKPTLAQYEDVLLCPGYQLLVLVDFACGRDGELEFACKIELLIDMTVLYGTWHLFTVSLIKLHKG